MHAEAIGEMLRDADDREFHAEMSRITRQQAPRPAPQFAKACADLDLMVKATPELARCCGTVTKRADERRPAETIAKAVAMLNRDQAINAV
jgi:hypothetical protein